MRDPNDIKMLLRHARNCDISRVIVEIRHWNLYEPFPVAGVELERERHGLLAALERLRMRMREEIAQNEDPT